MEPAEGTHRCHSQPARDIDPTDDFSTPQALREFVLHYARKKYGEFCATAPPLTRRKGGHDLSTFTEVRMPDPCCLPRPSPNDFMAEGLKVVLWSPEEQYPRAPIEVACPKCLSVTNISFAGWSPSLRSLKCCDRENFILARRYSHANCGANGNKTYTFHTLNSVVLAKLPPYIRAKLPEVITDKVAVGDAVIDLLQRDIVSGKSIQDTSDTFKELQAERYYRQMACYYGFYADQQQRPSSRGQMRIDAAFAPRQPIEAFPPLDTDAGYKVGLGRKALTTYYIARFKERAEYMARWMSALGGRAQKGDHCFKSMNHVTAADGDKVFEAVFDMMNEFSQITMLIFTTSTSMEEISSALAELADGWAAAKALMPEVFYVDNSESMGGALQRCFPGVMVLEDLCHVLRRYGRSLEKGHELCAVFMRELSRAMLVVDEFEEAVLKKELLENGKWGALGSRSRLAGEQHIRKNGRHTVPPPTELAARVEAVFNRFKDAKSRVSGRPLFTQETLAVHNQQMKLIKKGRLSDPFPKDEMYLNVGTDEKPRWLCVRGSSALEGFHSHLNGLLQGNRTSPELAQALVADFVHRWNVDAGVRNRGDKNYGTYNLQRLEEISARCQALGLSNPFPGLRCAPLVPDVPNMFNLPLPPQILEAAVVDYPVFSSAEGILEEFGGAFAAINGNGSGGGNFATAAPPAVPSALPDGSMPAINYGVTQELGVGAPIAASTPPALLPLPTSGGTGLAPTSRPHSSHGHHASQEPFALVSPPDQFSGPPPPTVPEVPVTHVQPWPDGAEAAACGFERPAWMADCLAREAAAIFFSKPSSYQPSFAPAGREEAVPELRKSPGQKRKAHYITAPAHAVGKVKSPKEKEIMMKIIGNDIASPRLTSSQAQHEVAEHFNRELVELRHSNPQEASECTFKNRLQVKEYLKELGLDVAAAAALHDLEAVAEQQPLSEPPLPPPMFIPQPQSAEGLEFAAAVAQLLPAPPYLPSNNNMVQYERARARKEECRANRWRRRQILAEKRGRTMVQRAGGEQYQQQQPVSVLQTSSPAPLAPQMPTQFGQPWAFCHPGFAYPGFGYYGSVMAQPMWGPNQFVSAPSPLPAPPTAPSIKTQRMVKPAVTRATRRGGAGVARHCKLCGLPTRGAGKVDGSCMCEKAPRKKNGGQ